MDSDVLRYPNDLIRYLTFAFLPVVSCSRNLSCYLTCLDLLRTVRALHEASYPHLSCQCHLTSTVEIHVLITGESKR